MAIPSEKVQLTWWVLLPILDISEKEIIRGKKWVFLILEPARLLGACKPGSRARMDSRAGLELVGFTNNGQKHTQLEDNF